MTPRRENSGAPLCQTSSSLRSRERSCPGLGVSLAAEAEHVEGTKNYILVHIYIKSISIYYVVRSLTFMSVRTA